MIRGTEMGLIEEFLEEVKPDKKYEMNLKDIGSFVSTYTPEKILSLSLDEYYHTGYRNTFCYRLEKGLVEYSSMGNVFPDAYRVYIGSDNCPHIFRGLKDRFGEDHEAAFAYIKKEIIRLIDAGKNNDYKFICNSVLDQRVRFKILSVYYPDSYFPVCGLPTARDYCDVFGIGRSSSETMLDLNMKLSTWSRKHLPSDWSLFHAMALSEWLRQNKECLDSSFFDFKANRDKAEKIEAEIEKLNLQGEEREAVVKQRVNQGVFRDMLITRDKHCRLCLVSDKQLLIASHIKPWAESTPEERLDADNGFLMCPNHDKLFDRGLISFDDDGKIMISSKLSETDRVYMNVRGNMQIKLTDRNKEYLQYHRKKIYNR